MSELKIYQSFKCEICWNEVELTKVWWWELICCWQAMKLTTENLTEVYLEKAFEWESMARNKYDYFGKQAKKEGYEQVSWIFFETALNEKEHAKRHFKFLNWIWNTAQNLKEAANGENYEHTDMYPTFAKQIRAEWNEEIAGVFEKIWEVEKEHEKRYNKLLENIKNWTVFKKENEIKWKCRNCWYIHTWKEPIDKCPACDHSKAYFEILSENY
jgi:rubrerythrin